MKPGDRITDDNGKTWEIGALVAAQGLEGCTDPRCRRVGSDYTADPPKLGVCVGYHCPTCGEPCSMMGHKCKAAA
jgi:hypothetical protein